MEERKALQAATTYRAFHENMIKVRSQGLPLEPSEEAEGHPLQGPDSLQFEVTNPP